MKELPACNTLTITIMANLLHKAYESIDTGKVESAIAALETLVRVEPMNIEAWEAYMQICETCEELDFVCERVLQIAGVNDMDRESVIGYYYFLRQKFKTCTSNSERQRTVILELVDQFDFTIINQSLLPGRPGVLSRFRQFFARLLEKIIVILNLVLFLIGLSLLSTGNSFGYWVLVVLLLGVSSSPWRVSLKMMDSHMKLFMRQMMVSHKRNDEIGYRPELIH